ncbi:hypothetical protein SANTM175S_08422 [Streptomyces antimycoticus]
MRIVYTYETLEGVTCTRIDVAEWVYNDAGGLIDLRQLKTIYVRRSEYRNWDA